MHQKIDDDLTHAAYQGDLDTVNALLAQGANVNHKSQTRAASTRSFWGLTPLTAAAGPGCYGARRENRLETVQALLSAGASVELKDRFGFTPLMRASESKNVAVTKTLLAAGASVHQMAPNGISALTISSYHGPTEQLQALLDAGADPNSGANEADRRPLTLAVYQNLSSPEISTAKIHALCDAGADINHQDNEGYTALHHAASDKAQEPTKALLAHGADTTLVNRKGETAEDVARGDAKTILEAHRERLQLRAISGLTDDQEPAHRARRM